MRKFYPTAEVGKRGEGDNIIPYSIKRNPIVFYPFHKNYRSIFTMESLLAEKRERCY